MSASDKPPDTYPASGGAVQSDGASARSAGGAAPEDGLRLAPGAPRGQRAVAAPSSTQSILVRMFGYRATTANHLTRFRQWIGTCSLFISLVSIIVTFALFKAHWFPVTVTVLPLIVVCALAGILWYGWGSAKISLQRLDQVQRLAYFLSYPMALYVGLVAAYLLNRYTDEYIAHLLLWQLCCGFALAALTGTNALQYGVRISLATLPTVFMLLQTSDTKYTSLAVLSYLAVCLATLIKLDLSEAVKSNARTVTQLTRQRDSAVQKLAMYLASTDDFLWETNRDGQITYLSDNFYRLTGCAATQSSRAGGISFDIVKSNIAQDALRQLQIAIAGRQGFTHLQVPVTRHDNMVRWYSCNGQPVFLKDGTFAGFKGIALDVSPSIQAREKIKSYTDRLEARVETRTAHLQARLEEMQKHADSAQSQLEERNAFFNALLIYLQELDHDGASPASAPDQHRLLTIASSAMRVAQNVRNNHDRVFSIDDLIHDSLADPLLVQPVNGCAITVTSLCGEQIFADPGALRIALMELVAYAARRSLSNDYRRALPAAPTINISVQMDDKGLNIIVSDLGAPFTDDVVEIAHTDVTTLLHAADFERDVASAMGMRLAASMVQSQGGTLTLRAKSPGRASAHQNSKQMGSGNEAILHLPRVRLFQRQIA